jgi:hypothetical protein
VACATTQRDDRVGSPASRGTFSAVQGGGGVGVVTALEMALCRSANCAPETCSSRSSASHSARHGKPNTAAAVGQRKPPVALPDGIARPEPSLHYTNWSRPISRLV